MAVKKEGMATCRIPSLPVIQIFDPLSLVVVVVRFPLMPGMIVIM